MSLIWGGEKPRRAYEYRPGVNLIALAAAVSGCVMGVLLCAIGNVIARWIAG
jgi:cytosine/uracil/thiamine/allantoin permease